MAFMLNINYHNPSKEYMFLQKGWGIRDVRGVYIAGRVALIQIPSYIFLYIFEDRAIDFIYFLFCFK